jgi:hypothetical protein
MTSTDPKSVPQLSSDGNIVTEAERAAYNGIVDWFNRLRPITAEINGYYNTRTRGPYYLDLCTFCEEPAEPNHFIRDYRNENSIRVQGDYRTTNPQPLTSPLPVCRAHYRPTRYFDVEGRLIAK